MTRSRFPSSSFQFDLDNSAMTSWVLIPNKRLTERGKIIRTIAAVRPKMKIRTRVRGGEFSSEILSEKIFTEGNKD